MAGVSDSTYLSMTELARRLDLPESTMRYYCKRFTKFLPYKGEGRRRRYAPETEKTLVFIANAMHRNKNATAVELMLQSGQFNPGLHIPQSAAVDVLPSMAVPQAVIQPAPAISAESGQLLISIMERQADALGKIAESLGNFVGHLAAQAERGAYATALPSSVQADSGDDLRQEILEIKQQMFTAEKVHQEDLEQLRKWLGHMGEAVAKLSG